jgi:co-chaperonin GroES (HSP10)
MKHRLPPMNAQPHQLPTEQQYGEEIIKRTLLQAEKENSYGDNSSFIADPDNGWMVVRRHLVTKTPGGVDIPESAQQGYYKVLAAGLGYVSGGARIAMPYKVGDIILALGAPIGQMFDNVALFLVNQQNVLSKVTKKTVPGN